MNELVSNYFEVPDWKVNTPNRSYPPAGNEERLQNVIGAYLRICPPENGILTPWKNEFLPAEIPLILRKFEKSGKNLLDLLNDFGENLNPAAQFGSAKQILRQETQSLALTKPNRNDISAAKEEAFRIIVDRNCENAFDSEYLAFQGSFLLKTVTKDIIKTGQRFMVWETIKDASDRLSSLQNPFGKILDLHLLGAETVSIKDRGIYLTFNLKTESGVVKYPYIIES